jgi:hypothetical protein
MEKATFKEGMAILTQCGLGELDKYQLKTWWLMLNKLGEESFIEAVMQVCQTQEKFWPGDNIPGMILARASEIGEAKAANRLASQNDRLLAEHATVPEEDRVDIREWIANFTKGIKSV